MKAVCPKDTNHDEFFTTAYVSETWRVDSRGDYIETVDDSDQNVLHGPTVGNIWSCATCGAEAKVEG